MTIDEIAEHVHDVIEGDTYLDEDGRDKALIARAVHHAIKAYRASIASHIAVLADAADGWADHVRENMESMREDDEDRDTDQAEIDAIHAAINALSEEG